MKSQGFLRFEGFLAFRSTAGIHDELNKYKIGSSTLNVLLAYVMVGIQLRDRGK